MLAPALRPALRLLCLPLCALAVAACGTTVSTTSFKGPQHEVAQAVANLQADATAAEQKKICANDLASTIVTRLGGIAGCEKAIKSQVAEVDSLEVSVQRVQITTGSTNATAHVKSTYGGKSRTVTVSLLKEGNAWKVSGLQ